MQHQVARWRSTSRRGHLWLRHVAGLWEPAGADEAQLAGNRVRYLLEHLAEETVEHAMRTCGARALIRPSPLERIYRDLSFYVRHDNDDHVLATIGREVLGQPYDGSFYKP